ncbi:MAG: hypothetical protein HYU29_02690 [Chloroflexi bacterium]|nr:hypothetical protein [Chloroflexota bacterium]
MTADEREAARDLMGDLTTLRRRLKAPIRPRATGHSFAGKLCGFYVFVMGESACISHPEWSQRDAMELCGFLGQQQFRLLVDTFGHYESLWQVSRQVDIYCTYGALGSIFDNLERLVGCLEEFKEQRKGDPWNRFHLPTRTYDLT